MTTAESWLVGLNAILGGATILLAIMTRKLELAWKKCSAEQVGAWTENATRQIGVQTWLTLEARFDSGDMRRARRALAEILLKKWPCYRYVVEDVCNFFETVGTAYKYNVVEKDLAESSFSYYLNYWWRAVKPYVVQERMRNKDDASLYEDFEKLADTWKSRNPELNDDTLKAFLQDEVHLTTEPPSVIVQNHGFHNAP